MELYDIEENTWQFTAPLPIPLFGGSVTVVNNRLFYFGGMDVYGKVFNTAYEYVPQPTGKFFSKTYEIIFRFFDFFFSGQEFNRITNAKPGIISYWKEHPNLNLNSKFLVALGYEL